MECDILVIGAGIFGLSSAFYLKTQNSGKRVVVIDRLGGPGQGNSAKSEGAFRNLFTSETNFLLADSTIDWFKHMEEDLGYHINLSYIGYLFLLSEEQYTGQRAAFDRIRGWGAEMRVLEREELEEMIPDLVTDFAEDEEAELLGLKPVDYGVLGRKCGSLDADALTRAYEEEFLKLGGEVSYGTEASRLILKPVEELEIPGEPFVWQDTHIAGAETSKGEIKAETTVIAAGAWSESLLDPIGFDSFMRPKKRQLFAFKDPRLDGLFKVEGLNDYGAMPLTVLPKASILFRPELSEGSIWLGCADNLGRRFKLEDDPKAEEDYYTNNVYHALVKYFPCFKDVRPMNMWADQYAINSFDEIPVVTSIPRMIYVGAGSGSGIMKCDAVARVAAALHGGEEEVELYGGRRFRVADLGIHKRRAERESLVI
ncbi:MAG: FAD-binding oxidoreductase [Candidatus Bathyarchaeota archaeon]|nr:MAG: FAD-binding oxidoreductase [Candidatus Bathyarchaeota archaeon]